MKEQQILDIFKKEKIFFYDDIEAAKKGQSFKDWIISKYNWSENEYLNYYAIYIRFGVCR